MKFYKKTDLIIIAAIVAIAAAAFFIQNILADEDGVKAEIYYFSELIKEVDLEKDRGLEIVVPQNENVIIRVDEEGRIAFIASDCPDKICIKTGKLHRTGEYAACLPNGVIVKIVRKGQVSEDDADIIVE